MDSYEIKDGNFQIIKEKDKKSNEKKLELVKEDKKDFFEIFKENKTIIYSVIFYAAGLLCGSYVYKKLENDLLNQMLAPGKEEFLQLFLNNLSLYFIIFTASVLLGVCLVGFPLLNIIPFFVGVDAGMKIAYFYINYSIKGIGYSLLMVAPFVCLFLTVIIYSVSMSYYLSKSIYDITVKKSDISEDFNYRIYLKKYLCYAGMIIIVALINTAVCTALNGIISL